MNVVADNNTYLENQLPARSQLIENFPERQPESLVAVVEMDPFSDRKA